MIRGDIAASAAGRALVPRLLIRRLKEVRRGRLCLRVSPFASARGRNPSKHGGGAKRFAYRHGAPDTGRGGRRLGAD